MIDKQKGHVMRRFSTWVLVPVVFVGVCATDVTADGVPEAWRSLDLDDLVKLAKGLYGKGDAGKDDRVLLAGHLAGKYFTDADATRSVETVRWYSFAQFLADDLSAQDRGVWSSKLRGAFAEAELPTGKQFLGLCRALDRLEGHPANDLAAIRITQTTGWKSWEPFFLRAGLLERLAKLGDAGKPARLAVAEHLEGKYLSSATATQSVNLWCWEQFVARVAADLSPEARGQWATKLEAAFGGAGKRRLAGLLRRLSPGRAADLAAQAASEARAQRMKAIITGTEWQSWPPGKLVSLARDLSGSVVKKETRAQLADHITTKYLASRTDTRRLSLAMWRSLAESLGRHLSPQQRRQWVAKLKAGYASGEEDLKNLKFGDAKQMAKVLVHLNATAAADILLAWLEANDQAALASVSPGELTGLVPLLTPADQAKKTEVMDRFDQHWQAAHAAKPMAWAQSVAITAALRQTGNLDKAKVWASRAYQAAFGTEQARAAADVKTLVSVADASRQVGLVGKGTGYAGFAATVARLAREGKLARHGVRFYYSCGLMLGTPETQQTVRAELVDAQGHLRLGVAKALTQVHANLGGFKAWRTYVDQGLAASADGDAKALWMLAKAYVEPASRPEPKWILARPWLEKALAEATSASVRLTAVGEFRDYYRVVGRPDLAASMLASVKNQFTGEELTTIAAWIDKDRRAAKWRALAAERRRAAREVRRKQSVLEYYRRRLALAESRGDTAKVTELKAAIEKLTAISQ